MSQDNEALFAVQEAVEKIHKLLEKRFPVAAEKAKKDLEAVRAAKTAKEARVSTERFSRVISDISDDSLKDFKVGLEDASKATKTFGEKLKAGAQKTVDNMLVGVAKTIPYVGALLGLALAEMIRTMTQSIDLERAGLGEALRTLGGGQLKDGFEQFRRDLNLTHAQAAELIKKYSSGIGLVGSARFLNSIRSLQDEFTTLGYSAADAAESMGKYAQDNELYLARNRLSQTQLDIAFRQNMMHVSKFSNLMKISREEMEKKRSLDNESAELQMFMAQMTEEQRNALRDVAGTMGESTKDMILAMYRTEKLYGKGTFAASDRYKSAMASGTNARFDSLYRTVMAGDDVSDPALVRQMSEMTDKQLQMTALIGEHTEYKQDDVFNSIVESNKFLEKIERTVRENLSPANDIDVKTGIELENTVPKLVGKIEEKVREIADQIIGFNSKMIGMTSDQQIKMFSDFATQMIDTGGDAVLFVIQGIQNFVEKIWNILNKWDGWSDIGSNASSMMPKTKTDYALLASPQLYMGKKAWDYGSSLFGSDEVTQSQAALSAAQTAAQQDAAKRRAQNDIREQQQRTLDDQRAMLQENKELREKLIALSEKQAALLAEGNEQRRRANSTGYLSP